MKRVKHIEEKYNKIGDLSKFDIGDTVLVYVKIKEEDKTRIQSFEGIVTKKKGSGLRATFTVRRVSYGEGLERTFLISSPLIDKIEVKKKGAVRRAKLYYLKKKKGKKAKVAEKINQRSADETPIPALSSKGAEETKPQESTEDAAPRTENK